MADTMQAHLTRFFGNNLYCKKLWEVSDEDHKVTAYVLVGRERGLFLGIEQYNPYSWDLYLPVSDSLEIEETLQALDAALKKENAV